MADIFKDIPAIPYEGPKSKNPLAFKYYDADRVVAFDLLSACGIAACALAAAITGRVLYLDVALGVAVVAFVGTLAWARAVEKRGGRRG